MIERGKRVTCTHVEQMAADMGALVEFVFPQLGSNRSVFTAQTSKGFDPHEIDMSTVPEQLRVIQRGSDPRHFEIVPQPGANLTSPQYADLICSIQCKAVPR